LLIGYGIVYPNINVTIVFTKIVKNTRLASQPLPPDLGLA